ncbi:MAG: Uma2 family endonuclease [Chloroflexi bacterium]|nr:Uma2 family endonuclease [Chloroflexota bacterium]MDA1271665.1 Uma2 family endonuclease [Chloroflexota bacterium]
MAAQLLRRRFTVDEYYRMAQAGILGEDDRLELLEGEIVEMAPIGSRHQSVVDRLTRLFFNRVGDAAVVRVQGPVRLSDESEPQPDLMLLRRRDDFYASAHPGPDDVILLVEVSDTSTEYDREVKLPMYARRGIAEVWLVGLETGMVEVFRGPTANGYQEASQAGRGQSLTCAAFPQLALAVDDILG